jgi:hypothetical protein
MPSDDVPCPADGCSNDSLDTEDDNVALRDDEHNSSFCHICGGLFTDAEVGEET